MSVEWLLSLAGVGTQVSIAGVIPYFRSCEFRSAAQLSGAQAVDGAQFLMIANDAHFSHTVFNRSSAVQGLDDVGCDAQFEQSSVVYICKSEKRPPFFSRSA